MYTLQHHVKTDTRWYKYTCTRMRPITSLHRTRMLIKKCRTLYSKCSFDLHSPLHEQGGKLKKLLHLQISSGLRSGRNRDTSLTDAKAPWAFLALTLSLLSIIQAPSLDLFMEEWMDRNMQLKRVLGCTSMCLLTWLRKFHWQVSGFWCDSKRSSIKTPSIMMLSKCFALESRKSIQRQLAYHSPGALARCGGARPLDLVIHTSQKREIWNLQPKSGPSSIFWDWNHPPSELSTTQPSWTSFHLSRPFMNYEKLPTEYEAKTKAIQNETYAK